MTQNIIPFPSSKIVRPPVVNNELIEKVQTQGITNLAESISAEIVSALMNDFDSAGLNTDTPQFSNDFNFLVLSVTATIYRALQLDHPFQQVLDQVKIVETEIKPETTQ